MTDLLSSHLAGSISAQLSSPRLVTEAMTMTYDPAEPRGRGGEWVKVGEDDAKETYQAPISDVEKLADQQKLRDVTGTDVANDLENKIRSNGFDRSRALVIDTYANGSMRLGDGYHRLAAARGAGLKTIPVNVYRNTAAGRLAANKQTMRDEAASTRNLGAQLSYTSPGDGTATGTTDTTYESTEATLSRIRTQLDHAVSSDAVAAITELADTLPAALPDDPETVGHVADGQTALAGAMAALQRAVDAAQAALESHEANNGPAHEAAQSAGGAPEREYVTGTAGGLAVQLAAWEHEPRSTAGRWFHGTSDVHAPGDIIDPSTPHRANFDPEHSEPKSVYIAGSVKHALHYAERDKGGLGEPHVYEVEPAGEHWPIAPGSDQHQTKSPIRVIREVDTATETSNSHMLTTDLAAWEHEA